MLPRGRCGFPGGATQHGKHGWLMQMLAKAAPEPKIVHPQSFLSVSAVDAGADPQCLGDCGGSKFIHSSAASLWLNLSSLSHQSYYHIELNLESHISSQCS